MNHMAQELPDVIRFGGEWHQDDIVGCAYPGTGDLYVKRGDEYRPAAFLLGKNVESVAGVCESAPRARRTSSVESPSSPR